MTSAMNCTTGDRKGFPDKNDATKPYGDLGDGMVPALTNEILAAKRWEGNMPQNQTAQY